MKGAETLKTMLPCKRRVHLHKSINFKSIFEQLLKSHKNDVTNESKMIEKAISKSSNK